MTDPKKPTVPEDAPPPEAASPEPPPAAPNEAAMALIKKVEEIGGPPGPEPTRYGDWQFNGRVTDF
ncbi:DUF1674 domain-containing protein [Reyranella sp.]|uniref:DUF1674 domain-containing protein n=1 Tax=Reyranella sp. TaxID=1929291 RepID=UPI0037832E12